MKDLQPIFITSSVIIITVLLTLIGAQLLLTLHEAKKLLKRSNEVIDEIAKTGVNLRSGYQEIYGFISGIRRLMTIADIFSRRQKSSTTK